MLGPKNPAGFGSDLDPVAGSTRPGKPAGYPDIKRTDDTPTVCGVVPVTAIYIAGIVTVAWGIHTGTMKGPLLYCVYIGLN